MTRNTKAVQLGGALALALLTFSRSARADTTVTLNPAYISGSISIGSETVNEVYVSASWTDPSTGTEYSADTSVSGGGSYTLTVNVPSGSSPTYTVYGFAYLNGYAEYLQLPSQDVAVAAFGTATANLTVTPGYIVGTVTPSSGTLTNGTINDGSSATNVSFGTDGSYRLVVIPDSALQVYGYASNANGYTFLDYQIVAVAAGETVQVDWSVAMPDPAVGAIAGSLAVNGSVSAGSAYIHASGPSSQSQTLPGNGGYSLSPLNAGSYYQFAYGYFGGASSTFLSLPDASFSPSRYSTVTAGATTTVDISANEAFINGSITLTGAKTLADTSTAQFSAYGVYGTNSFGGAGYSSISSPNGAYSLVLTDGSWTPSNLTLTFNHPAPAYLNAYLSFTDYQVYANPVVLSPGAAVTQNRTYATGTVTIAFAALGNITFSSPYVNGNCSRFDASHNLVWSYSVNAYNDSLSNVSQGSVTFVGMEGTCSLMAYANTNGSNTTFGSVTVDVVPGKPQVIDISGPTLAVTFPEGGYITSNSTLVVTGTATDEAGVSGVTVNGADATLTPTGNPLDSSEVAFSATINLGKGPNTVTTIASGPTAKTAQDIRTVYSDSRAPTLAWTPPDNSTTANADVTAIGTATDDAVIQSITINGQPATLQSTNNPSDVHEVSFSVQVTLSAGDNFVTVVATDVSTQSTSQTHKVTVDTTPPTIDGHGTVTAEAGGPHGAAVSYTPPAWHDAVSGDGTAACSPVSGTLFALGDTLITCTGADAAGNLASSTFIVTVRDTTPPALYLPAPISIHSNAGASVSFAATATDIVDLTDEVTCSPASGSTFPLGSTTVNCSAKDRHGNTSTGAFSVTVSASNNPPVCAAAVAVPASLWPPNHKLVKITIGGVTDPDGGVPSFKVLSIFQDEPTNGGGDGNTAIDGNGVGTSQASVRAERSGNRNGRVYYIKFSASDSSGASCTGTVTVGVPASPGHPAVGDGPKHDSTKPGQAGDEDEHHGCGDGRDHDHDRGRDRDDHDRKYHGKGHGGNAIRDDGDDDHYGGRGRD